MWYVEYYDEEGYWYLDSDNFVTRDQAENYWNTVKKPGFELVKIFRG